MQQLFNGKWENQNGQMTFIPPTLRFKADDGSEFPDWEEKKLGEVFKGRIRSQAMVNDTLNMGELYDLSKDLKSVDGNTSIEAILELKMSPVTIA